MAYARYNHSIMQHGRQYRTKKCIGQSSRGFTLCLCNKTWIFGHLYIDSLVLDCSISIANALEILHSCTKPSISICIYINIYWIIMTMIYRRDRHIMNLALCRIENWWNAGIHINLVLCLNAWRHQKETFSAKLAICAGNSPASSEFHVQRLVARSFDVFFDLRLNKRLSKPLRCWWFETPSPHYDITVMISVHPVVFVLQNRSCGCRGGFYVLESGNYICNAFSSDVFVNVHINSQLWYPYFPLDIWLNFQEII